MCTANIFHQFIYSLDLHPISPAWAQVVYEAFILPIFPTAQLYEISRAERVSQRYPMSLNPKTDKQKHRTFSLTFPGSLTMTCQYPFRELL